MPHGKMRAWGKVPKNAHLKTLRVEKSMAGDGANSGGLSKDRALEAQDSLGETCFHNWAAPRQKVKNVSSSSAQT